MAGGERIVANRATSGVQRKLRVGLRGRGRQDYFGYVGRMAKVSGKLVSIFFQVGMPEREPIGV